MNDAIAAFALLTRLPVGRLSRAGMPDLSRAVWAFPLVGLVIGLSGGLIYGLTHRLGMTPFLAASWAIAAMLLVTGAFHEDGLADTADGFGGGATRERKMEIMRDSRIGTYGALALAVSLIVRVGALASLGRPYPAMAGLVAAAMLGRGGIVVTLLVLKPARQDGMAAGLHDIPKRSAGLGLALAFLAPFLCLPVHAALTAVAVAVVFCLAVAWLARAQIGGHSGDVLGAGVVMVECAVLSAIAAVLG